MKTVKRLVNKILIKSNKQIVKLDQWDYLHTHHDLTEKLIEIYTDPTNYINNHSIECLVFSMDRALQLHALLSSLYENLSKEIAVHILYKSTTEAHEKAYQEVFQIFKNKDIRPVRQFSKSDFKPKLLETLKIMKSQKMFFLVDDIIFTEKINLNEVTKYDTRNFVFSLRLGKNINYSLNHGQDESHPKFYSNILDDNQICWRWSEGEIDWRYTVSVDGHVLGTKEITLLAEYTDFATPTYFEANIQKFQRYFMNRYGVAFEKSRTVNIPVNQVQTETENVHGEVHQDDLLKIWNEGKKIDFKKLQGYVNKSAHEVINLEFIKR